MRVRDPRLSKEEAYRRAAALLPATQRTSAIERLRKAQRKIDAASLEVAARTREAASLLASGRVREALATGFASVSPFGVYAGPVLPTILSEKQTAEIMTPKVRRALAAKASATVLADILRNIARDLEGGRLCASAEVRDAIADLTGHASAALEEV
jgi:hypothetical protein